MGSVYTDAQKKATMKYCAKKERISIWCDAEKKKEYITFAKAKGYKSLSGCIIDILDRELEKAE